MQQSRAEVTARAAIKERERAAEEEKNEQSKHGVQPVRIERQRVQRISAVFSLI